MDALVLLGVKKAVMCCFRIGTSRVKKLKPHPQNKILVPVRDSFQNFRQVPLLLYGSTPPRGVNRLLANVLEHRIKTGHVTECDKKTQ